MSESELTVLVVTKGPHRLAVVRDAKLKEHYRMMKLREYYLES